MTHGCGRSLPLALGLGGAPLGNGSVGPTGASESRGPVPSCGEMGVRVLVGEAATEVVGGGS